MKQWLKQGVRFFLVTSGVIFLTSFTIDATDTLRGSQTALSILTDNLTSAECPKDMVRVDTGTTAFCIDRYEASPGLDCVYRTPRSSGDTALNAADSDCRPVSEAGRQPWVFVSQPQAMQLCAKAGKRLATPYEWYRASLGTPDSSEACNVNGALQTTGAQSSCVSGAGMFDAVGNVWELVDGTITNGAFGGVSLPEEGYVAGVDEQGLPKETSDTPQSMYQADYFWAESVGDFVIMRGGFYGSQGDGGLYATHGKTPTNFAGPAVGFRCALSKAS